MIAKKDGVIILKYDNGASRCIGFVNFVDVDGQRNALSKMNGQTVDGNVISVEEGVIQEDYQPFTDCHFYMKEECTKTVRSTTKFLS